MALIPRPWFANEVRTRLATVPAVGILGARQVGKTTLAKAIAEHRAGASTYLDLQLPSARRRLVDPEAFLRSVSDRLVILDEVQTMPELFPVLRGLIDERRVPGRFLLLGSASPHLLRNSGESLAGRISYLELTPLLLEELPDDLTPRSHWLRGGYPEALLGVQAEQVAGNAAEHEARMRWYADYVAAFVARDLPDLADGLDRGTMTRLLSMLSYTQGGQLNYTKLANSLDRTGPTIARYVDVLEHAFLIRRLPPYIANVTKRLVKSPKVYLRDSGLLHGLQRIATEQQLLGHPLVGASWEGYAIEQLLARTPPLAEAAYYRTATGLELDLVLEAPGRPLLAFEMKFSTAPTLTKGFFAALDDVQPAAAYVVVPEGEPYPVREDVSVVDIAEAMRLVENWGA